MIEQDYAATLAMLRARGPILKVFMLGTGLVVCWRLQTELWTERGR